jgi:hypothetical protein
VFLARKARGKLSLSLLYSGITIAIPLELTRAFYSLFDFISIRFDNKLPIRFYICLVIVSLPFILYNKSTYKDKYKSDTVGGQGLPLIQP